MQELAECLADPLMPKFSHRFFTGGAAAAVGVQHSTSNADEPSDAGASSSQQAPIVQQAVKYANKMQNTRKHGAVEQGEKKREGKQKKAAKQPSRPANISREEAEEQALQAALNKSRVKKDLRQRNSKLMVIPAAFGRERQGSDALQALRAKMGASQTVKKQ